MRKVIHDCVISRMFEGRPICGWGHLRYCTDVPYTDAPLSPPIPKSRINARITAINIHWNRFRTLACKRRKEETKVQGTQGPEEMCLSLEHQDPSKTSEKWVILIALQFRYTSFRPQTKGLRARKIGLQYKIRMLYQI